MTDPSEPAKPGVPSQSGPQTARNTDMLLITYICYLISVVFGITVILGLVISYMQRQDVAGTWRESHYTWLIRTFWIGLLYGVVSMALATIGIGFLLALATLVWFIIRVVKGWMRYANEEPVANVESWFIG
jgi:uncharacterized membrane protein